MIEVWKKKKLNVKTYEPKKQYIPAKEITFSWLGYFGSKLVAFGGFLTFFFSSIFLGIRGFFSMKKKIRTFQYRNSRVIDLRKKSKC